MSSSNIILIKRRLADSLLGVSGMALSAGEIAFNEVNNTLYFGHSQSGVMAIAGPGQFVDVTNIQSVSGNKTFAGQTVFTDTVTVNSSLDASSYIEANSFKIDGTTVIDSNRDAFFVDVSATGNVTIDGNLTVLGALSQIDTDVTSTSAFSITNSGTTIALQVTQTGSTDVAEFKDDANTALIIKNGGNVGINTASPGEKLTVSGNISASGSITGGAAVYTGLTVNGNETLTGYLSGSPGVSGLYGFFIDGGSF